MSTPLVSTIALFLTTLAPTVQASWRMGAEVLLSARMDPLIAPGAVSGHVHDVVGGSNFKNTYDYDELRRSECSSVEVQDDLSNYWAPAVYYQHTDGKYELVPSSYAIYYLHRGDEPNRDIKQFPAGFRMIAGSAVKNSFGDASEDKAISFKCLSYQEPPIPETREFPKRHCPDGIRVQVLFPSCWNGIDPTSANYKTHVSYPQNGVAEGGICPSSHPVRLMTLFYEHIVETGKFQYREGAFSFSHGDNVGWSNHGDFQNGWDASPNSVLAQAIRECNPQDGANLSSCGVLMRSVNAEKAKTCRPKTYLPLEDIGIYGGLSQLPGDNPIWGGGRAKNLRGGANIPPWASAFSTLAPGWTYHGCIDEGNIYVNAMTGDKRLDGNNYPGACVDYCESKGFTMAGLEAGNECYCANELTNGGRMDRVDAGLCSWTCPGSAYELCGGGRKISLYTKSDRSRGGSSAGSYPPVGSRFTQVYTSDGSAPPPLPGNGGTNPPPSGNGGTNPPPSGNGGTNPPPSGNGGTNPPPSGNGGTSPPPSGVGTSPNPANPSPGSGSSPNPSPPSQPVHPQCTMGIRRKKRSLAERKIDNAKYASHIQYSHRRHMYPGAHH